MIVRVALSWPVEPLCEWHAARGVQDGIVRLVPDNSCVIFYCLPELGDLRFVSGRRSAYEPYP